MDAPAHSAETRLRFCLLLAAGISGVNLIGLWLWFHPQSISLGATGGVWTALAYDFSQGIFYRPLFDASGYGGTRYLFLFFVLHGFLIRVFNDPVLTGFALVTGFAITLNLGLYFLQRALGIERKTAAAFSLLAAAPISYQLLTLEVMGEFLSSSLAVWGLVFAWNAMQRGGRGLWVLSCVCFSGAFLTKFSAVAAVTAFALFFIKTRPAEVLRLLVGTAALILLGLWTAQAASEGRMGESFQVFQALPVRWDYALKFPLWFAMILLRDPFLLALSGFALYGVIRAGKAGFACVYFLVVLAVSCVILTSPGTDYNHLLDLIVASVLVLSLRFADAPRAPRPWLLLLGFVAGGLAFTWIPGTISVKQVVEGRGNPPRAVLMQAIEEHGLKRAPVLSENPLIPILMDRRPRVMDPFSVRLLAEAMPEVRADFSEKIRNRFYGAIVLQDFSGAPDDQMEQALENHTSPGAASFYGEVHFPHGFLPLLKENYYLGAVLKPHLFFFPRDRQEKSGSP